MNKCILIGRLTKDPELKITSSGVDMCAFTIAVDRPFTNANGEKEADFINCVAFKIVAANLAKYQKKGSLIAVDGTLQTRKYQAQDGSNRVATDVIANNIVFLTPVAKPQEQPKEEYNPFGECQGSLPF